MCDILSHLESYGGRLVRVHGTIQSDVDLWITADCPTVIRVGSVEFLNLIALAFPDSVVHDRPKIEVTFNADAGSAQALFRGLAARNPKTQGLHAVVEGLVITRSPPFALVSRSDPAKRIGFGHTGMAPAMIVIKRISEIEVRARR
ncbi:MAG: hypothetical protein IT161_00365 [Bryobacterales bacterium]|nr:hypothetical protein [Bryobacterales bacterium]